MGEEKPIVGIAICKIARPAMIRNRRPEMVVRSCELLAEGRYLGSGKLRARHGARGGSDLGGSRLVTARQTPHGTSERGATGVLEVGRRKKRKRMRGSREGRILPTKPGDPPKRFGRRETLDSSVLVGATHQVHAGRKV